MTKSFRTGAYQLVAALILLRAVWPLPQTLPRSCTSPPTISIPLIRNSGRTTFHSESHHRFSKSLYQWDYLARPPGIVPNTAAAAPEITADGKTWTVRIKPGIYFTDDPAFCGKPRELVAEDYVYSIKRGLDASKDRGLPWGHAGEWPLSRLTDCRFRPEPVLL